MKYRYLIVLLGCVLVLASCDRGPRVISTPVQKEAGSSGSTGIFADDKKVEDGSQREGHSSPKAGDMHTVEVLEVLPTEKYVYLYVEEGREKYWVATGKREVEVGKRYFFRNGILKTNFESKEYNRVFDKVYLVANIVAADHGGQEEVKVAPISSSSGVGGAEKIEREGSIRIADLVANKEEYDGKEVQISGKCTKLNPNIMNRNWIHLKDGSMDEFDLVVTSELAVPEGHIVTMKGTVVLNKDFGAGYMYDLIIENGQIVTAGK